MSPVAAGSSARSSSHGPYRRRRKRLAYPLLGTALLLALFLILTGTALAFAPAVSLPAGSQVVVGGAITLTGQFTDPDVFDPDILDGHTATWDWGDGNPATPGAVTEPANPTTPGQVTGTHIYGKPGIYTVTLKVTDDRGGGTTVSASMTVTVLGVALYSGVDADLAGSSRIESPLVANQPSAATLVSGTLTTAGTSNVSRTVPYVGGSGIAVPPLSRFMPDALVSSLVEASQAAQATGTVYQGLSFSGKKSVSFAGPITVEGNLTISGPGTYNFASVYVTGNVRITDASVNFASLRVGGTLTVSGKATGQWGPTFVAGDVSFSSSGQWGGSLLVTDGNLVVSGASKLGGDGERGHAQPVRILLIGEAKQATIGGSATLFGLLFNQFGGLSLSGSSSITGCALLGGSYTAIGSSKVVYDGDIIGRFTPRFTLTFHSNGGGLVEPLYVYQGQALGSLPAPRKDGCIFLGWYTDDGTFTGAVSKDTTALGDLDLYADYLVVEAVQETDEITSISALDCPTDFAIHLVSSDANMVADDVKALLQLKAVDGSPAPELTVAGGGGEFTVTAAGGYTPGTSYKLTLTDDRLTLKDPDTGLPLPAGIRTYHITIYKPVTGNLQLDPGLLQIPADDVTGMSLDGRQVESLSLPLATTEGGVLTDTGETGTFIYTGSTPIAVGDIVAIYMGTPPEDRDPAKDYSDEGVAYVEVIAIDGTTVTYRLPQAADVLFTPDVLPVNPAHDLDGNLDDDSITIPVSEMTYTGQNYAEVGLTLDTVVEAGDYLAFCEDLTEANEDTESPDEEAASFAKISSVQVVGDNYVIVFQEVTEDELRAAMDLYSSSHDQDYSDVLEDADIQAMEEAIEKQAMDSGFADAAARYLKDLALQTDGFKSQPHLTALATGSGDGGSMIENLEVHATINTSLEHFAYPNNSGLDCGVEVSFDIACSDDLNIHVSATFEQEVRVTFNASGGAVWKTKKVWIFKIPYIADYKMTGNVDLYNYTGISIQATITTSAGDDSPLDIAEQITDLMTAPSYDAEEISAGTQAFYDLYAEMLANEHGYVEIFKQQIVHTESGIDPLHILVGGLTLEFVVNADVNLSIGADFDYKKGTRYTFTLLLFSKQATSDQVTLVDEQYNFDFYVMGTMGLRAGIVARVEVGLFSLGLDSIGLEIEAGPYVRLWGYFFYELHYANQVRTSQTSGALYLQLGVYLETRFLAQALGGQYSYNPTLYEHEWPLWTAGSRYNTFDFGYNLTDATDDIRLKGTTRTYSLPTTVFNMKQLDLTEGDVATTSHTCGEFTITFTNSNFSFSPATGLITVVPPAGQHITEGYMTIRWNGAPLSFTTVPISRTYHLVWDDLASSYTLSFNSQGGNTLSPIVGAYGSTVTLPTPVRAGYTFGGWYQTSDCGGTRYIATTMPAQNLTLYAKWTANTNTPYTVRHYQQTVAGTSYTLVATQNLTGTTGGSVTPPTNTYTGFTSPAAQTVAINGSGSTVVNYNYTRKSYTLTFKPGTPDADIVRTGAFGAQLTAPVVTRAGYTFGGWYRDSGYTTAFTATTFPAENLTLYAKWTANANVAYTVKHYKETPTGSYELAETQTFSGTTGASVTPATRAYDHFTTPATQTVTIKGDGSTVVRYEYRRQTYNLICHPDNGQDDIIIAFRYGQDVVTPAVTWGDATFCGWYEQDAVLPYVPGPMPAHDVELWGAWTVPPVISLIPAISVQLSSGEDATVFAPAWVKAAITLTWEDTAGVAPSGSVVVTGTMPDGHTWQVYSGAIPAGATSPYTFDTTDQQLGTGAAWEGGVLGEGTYQFQAQYIPDSSSYFEAVSSDVEQVAVTAPVGWSENFDSYAVGSDIHGQGGWQNIDAPNYNTRLKVSNAVPAHSGGNSLELTPQTQQGDIRIVGRAFPQVTSGTWEVSFWYYTNYGSMNTERAMFQIDSELYARDLRCSGEWLFLPDGSMWPTSIVPNATWVPVRWQVDLDKHTCQVWFDGTLVYTGVFPAASLTFVVGSLNGPIVNGYIDDVSITPFTP